MFVERKKKSDKTKTQIDLINVLISLLIPYFISLVIESITNKYYNISIVYILLLGLTFNP